MSRGPWNCRAIMGERCTPHGERHIDEKVYPRVVDGVEKFDLKCTRCGRLSENWQEATTAHARMLNIEINPHDL